MKCNYYWKMQL